MSDLNWIKAPEPIKLMYDFVESTNQARSLELQIDTAQVLANKVACQALRSYFVRILESIERGDFDPDAIADLELALAGVEEYDDDRTD